jgi:FkbM family methyltransferase
LIDVGASGGPPARWLGLGDSAEIIGFEPDLRAHESMKPIPGYKWLNVALYSHSGKMRLYLTRKQDCSSFFPPNRAVLDRFPESNRFDVVGTEDVDVDTLDRQLVGMRTENPDFLKVDVQGAELGVLQGGVRALETSLVGVQAEVCFIPLYEDQPLFADVDIFLRNLGFALFDLNGEFWKGVAAPTAGNARGQLIFGDAVYLKSVEAFVAMVAHLPVSQRVSKILKAARVVGLYGYQDHGVALLKACKESFEPAAFDQAIRTFSKQVPLPRRIPDFPGRRKAAGLAYQLYRLLRPRYWADYPTRFNRG